MKEKLIDTLATVGPVYMRHVELHRMVGVTTFTLVVASLCIVNCAAGSHQTGHSPGWFTGNTQAVRIPERYAAEHDDNEPLIPPNLCTLQSRLVDSGWHAFLGPTVPSPQQWKNVTHLWDLDTATSAAVAAWALIHQAHELGAPLVEWSVLEARQWTLCASGTSKISYGNRCDAFRTPRGMIGFGVAVVRDVKFSIDIPGNQRQVVRVQLLEETRQLPRQGQQMTQRCQFVHRAIEWWVNRGRVESPILSKSPNLDMGWENFQLLSIEWLPVVPFSEAPSSASSLHDDDKSASNVAMLRVVTQNIWNFNGNWTYRSQKIADDLCGNPEVIADVFTLQEVRYHSDRAVVGSAAAEGPMAQRSRCQMVDLLDKISARCGWRITDPAACISAAFYPAMTYLQQSRREGFAIEMEGPMNIVAHSRSRGREQKQTRGTWTRGYSSVEEYVGSYTFPLSRDANDADDAHQRLVLCSVILLRMAKPDDLHALLRVDVCTSHFSLGEQHQNRNAEEAILSLEQLRNDACLNNAHGAEGSATACQVAQRADVTIFTGDLNSEPHHDVYRIFTGNGFMDAWRMKPTKILRNKKEASSPTCVRSNHDEGDDDVSEFRSVVAAESAVTECDGCTFNTREPSLVKRIDFILIKQWSADIDIDVTETRLIGEHPLDPDAVASDHLGVFASLRFQWTSAMSRGAPS